MFITALMAAALLASAPDPVSDVVNQLAREPAYTSEAIGYAGTTSPAYELFSRLVEVADDHELRGLLDHASPVVRLYAFQGLIRRDFDAARLVGELDAKEALVDVQYGCTRWRTRVGRIAKQIVEDHRATL